MLTAAKLIEELQKVPPGTQIRVYADHGQQCMMAHTWGVQYVHIGDWRENMADKVSLDDVDDIEAMGLVQVFEIGAP